MPLHCRTFLTPLLLILAFQAIGQNRLYFDKHWKRTDQKQAAYYRVFGEASPYYPVADYYISGKQQFAGTSHTMGDSLVLEGLAKWYAEDGQTLNEATYRQGRVYGTAITYYTGGMIRLQRTLHNDTLEGPLVEYYPWGDVRGRADYRNGKKVGVYQTFTAKSEPLDMVHYKDGLPDGPYERYAASGSLKYKGTAAGGQAEGTCYVYFDDGGLRQVFTVHNKLLDGRYLDFGSSGDTVAQGQFKDGVPLHFKCKGKMNGSDFTMSISLKDGVETGKVRRDGKVVLEYAYQEGRRTGTWKLYRYDGKELLGTKNFTGSDCSDTYLQSLTEKFSPQMSLSSRFSIRDLLENRRCPIIANDRKEISEVGPVGSGPLRSDHPLYYYRESKTDKEALSTEIAYKDAAGGSFRERNQCVAGTDQAYPGLQICTRRFGGLIMKVYTSEHADDLRKLHASLQPDAHTCLFFYQQIPERSYPHGTQLSRLMLWRLSTPIKEAIKRKTLDAVDLIYIIEHDFFRVDDFSGLGAYRALDNEVYPELDNPENGDVDEVPKLPPVRQK